MNNQIIKSFICASAVTEFALVAIDSAGKVAIATTPTANTITISSKEPSWIALRRQGTIEFEGILDGERTIDNPDEIEIYAGRPDLVTVSIPNREPMVLGTISAIEWMPLNPEGSR